MEGDDYYSLIGTYIYVVAYSFTAKPKSPESFPDEFMAAIKLRWPTALVQFEDFQSKHAIKLLMRYKKEYLMFNDDIQVRIASVKLRTPPPSRARQPRSWQASMAR